MKVIVLISQAFNPFVEKKLYLMDLIKQNFEVEVFDCSLFMMPGHSTISYQSKSSNLIVLKIASRADLFDRLIDNKGKVIAIDMSNKDPAIRAKLNEFDIKTIRLLTGGLPFYEPRQVIRKQSLFAQFRRIYRSFYIKNGFKILIRRLVQIILEKYQKRRDRPYLDSIILGAEQLLNNESDYINSNTHIIRAHVYDYDNYLSSLSEPLFYNPKPYVVFLDQNIPYHQDFSLTGGCYKEPTVYYHRLQNVFDNIELLGYDVIVSLHPRSSYKENLYRFGKRKVIKGETSKLVRACDGVMMHCSNTINFAVMQNKPIIFLADQELLGICFQIELLCQWFKTTPIMMDRNMEKQNIETRFEIAEGVYARYIKNFVKCEQDKGSNLSVQLINEINRMMESYD